MKIFAALRDAVQGWIALLRGEPDWARHFTLSLAGLATALALFLFIAIILIALVTLDTGLPGIFQIASGVFVQALSILALVLGIFFTRRFVTGEGSFLAVLVPGVYALIGYLLAGTVFSLVMGPGLMLLWLVLAYLFYVLGRRAGGWTRGVSAAFAVLSVVLLVGMPVTLYMVLGPVAAPTQ